MQFFNGSVVEAVRLSKAEARPLMVFLTDGGDASACVSSWLHTGRVSQLVQEMRAIVLRLPDHLSSETLDFNSNARMFRQLYPTDVLPTVTLVGLDGQQLAMLKDVEQREQWLEQLQQASQQVAAQRQELDRQQAQAPAPQQQQQMAAEAVMLLAQAALAQQNSGQPAAATPQSAAATPQAFAEEAPAAAHRAVTASVPAPATTTPVAAQLAAAAAPEAAAAAESEAAAAAGSEAAASPQQVPLAAPAAADDAIAASVSAPGTTAPAATQAAVAAAPDPAAAETAPAASQESAQAALAAQLAERAQAACCTDAAMAASTPAAQAPARGGSSTGHPVAQPAARPAATARLAGKRPREKAAAACAEPAPVEPPGPARVALQVRLPDGRSIRSDFAPDAPLHEVRSWVDMQRPDGGGPYLLLVPYPKRVLGQPDLDCSLAELGLEGRCSLVLEPGGVGHSALGFAPLSGSGRPGGGAAAAAAGPLLPAGALGAYLATLRSLLSSLLAYVSPWTYRASSSGPGLQQDSDAPRKGSGEGGSSGDGPAVSVAAGASAVRRRGGPGGNVHGLTDLARDEQPDRKHNTFWNGNSTQFGADDDADSKDK